MATRDALHCGGCSREKYEPRTSELACPNPEITGAELRSRVTQAPMRASGFNSICSCGSLRPPGTNEQRSALLLSASAEDLDGVGVSAMSESHMKTGLNFDRFLAVRAHAPMLLADDDDALSTTGALSDRKETASWGRQAKMEAACCRALLGPARGAEGRAQRGEDPDAADRE